MIGGDGSQERVSRTNREDFFPSLGMALLVSQFCTCTYVFAIVNSNLSTFLLFLLRWTRQRGRKPGSPNLARKMITLPSPSSFVSSRPSPESIPVHSPFFPTPGDDDDGCGGRGGGIESLSPSLDVGRPY